MTLENAAILTEASAHLGHATSCDSFNAMSVGHYENFPVASWLMPASCDRRCARSTALRERQMTLPMREMRPHRAPVGLVLCGRSCARSRRRSRPTGRTWLRRSASISCIAAVYDLLSAFSQDVVTVRYDSFETLTDYCRRSANPVGRLLLQLFRRSEAELLQQSDAICTGLQLANFWQDVAIDWQKGRVYLPQQRSESTFGVSEAQIARGTVDQRWQSLMAFEVQRTREFCKRGAPLARLSVDESGSSCGWSCKADLRILERIDAVNGDVFRVDRQLSARDWTLMGWRCTSLRDIRCRRCA